MMSFLLTLSGNLMENGEMIYFLLTISESLMGNREMSTGSGLII